MHVVSIRGAVAKDVAHIEASFARARRMLMHVLPTPTRVVGCVPAVSDSILSRGLQLPRSTVHRIHIRQIERVVDVRAPTVQLCTLCGGCTHAIIPCGGGRRGGGLQLPCDPLHCLHFHKPVRVVVALVQVRVQWNLMRTTHAQLLVRRRSLCRQRHLIQQLLLRQTFELQLLVRIGSEGGVLVQLLQHLLVQRLCKQAMGCLLLHHLYLSIEGKHFEGRGRHVRQLARASGGLVERGFQLSVFVLAARGSTGVPL
mmetsp:Transcript_13716/g.34214  ORF Transcript_13716/g.34214 Transcript_13716/m.34214 type:complete len:256 (-) Transcript_13716:607-1374(-)